MRCRFPLGVPVACVVWTSTTAVSVLPERCVVNNSGEATPGVLVANGAMGSVRETCVLFERFFAPESTSGLRP